MKLPFIVVDMKAIEFKKLLERTAQYLGPEEGFRFGDPNIEVSGILISWMTTTKAIERAIKEKCNFMIVHEDLFYPYGFQRDAQFETCFTWSANYKRLKMLSEHDITVFRAHGTLDRLCVLDAFAEALSLPEPSVKYEYVRIYDIPETTAGQLALEVKRRLDLEVLRFTGKPNHIVKRIGLPWGGLGLSLNIRFIETLLKHEPDALIAGETDEYATFYALDAGVDMIETGHSVSENIGLKEYAETLKREYPETKVVFFECERPWAFL